MTIKGIMWNARGWSNKDAEIWKRLQDYDIGIITETKSKRTDHFNVPGYITIMKNNYNQGNGGAGGVAIFIKRNTKFREIDIDINNENLDVIGLRIDTETTPVVLMAIYRRPGRIEKKGTWLQIIEEVEKKNNNMNDGIIMMGDFNAHHMVWNCCDTDKNGENLFEELEEKEIYVINSDTLSRMGETGQRDSNIDLIFSSHNVLNLIDYKQEEDTWGSDHYPIEFQISLNRKVYRKKTNRISTKKTNWKKYIDILMDKEEEVKSQNFLDLTEEERYDKLIQIMKEAVLRASGKNIKAQKTQISNHDISNNNKNKRNPVDWWDIECEEVIEDRKKALKIYKNDPTLENYIDFKKNRAIARKTNKKKKKESIINFARELNRFTNPKYVWNKMNVMKNRDNKRDWNKWKDNDREAVILNEIDKVAPPWVETDPNGKSDKDEEESFENSLSVPFTMAELERALKCCKEKSSPGLDNIEYRMIKHLTSPFKTVLLKCLNHAFCQYKLFRDWKNHQTIFIDKKNKHKVRPITLSSCVEKVLERLINERLIWLCENKDWFDKNQFGFRRGKSCLDNLTRLIGEAEISRQSNNNTVAAFLDVSSAYDNVKIDLLIAILRNKGCPKKIREYIKEWGRNRITNFVINEDKIITRTVNKGLPQGGVLSPTLYNIYTSEITKEIEKEVAVIQYADDIALYYSNKSLNKCKKKIEQAIDLLYNNLGKLGLDLEPSKTNLIVFNNKKGAQNKKIVCKIKGIRI